MDIGGFRMAEYHTPRTVSLGDTGSSILAVSVWGGPDPNDRSAFG